MTPRSDRRKRVGSRDTGRVIALAVALAALATGIAGSSVAEASPGKLRVVTTVAPITSIVANVGGDLVEIRGLIPEGSDSHTFEPPPSAAETLAEADIVFVNGLKLEDPTKALAQANRHDGAEIVELGTRTISKRQYIHDFSFPKAGGKPNPHLWTNPPYAKRYARIAADTFERRDPRHARTYETNYRNFAAKVDELDNAMRAASASMPAKRRELVTYHDAYAYFGRHYGWRIIGAIQPSNFEEPTPKEVAGLIEQVKREGVRAIFGSEVFPSPVLAQIGRETGVRYVDALRDDDLPGGPGDRNHSWLGLMKFDFVTMVKNLRGDTAALDAVKVENVATDTARYPQ